MTSDITGNRHLEQRAPLRRRGRGGRRGDRAGGARLHGALWMPDVGGDVFGAVDRPPRRHDHDDVATGHPQPLDAHARGDRRRHAALTAEHGDRFLVGIGVSHGPLIDRVKEPGDVPAAAGADVGVPRRARRRRSAAAPRPTGCSPRSDRRCSSSPAPAPPARTRTSSRPSTRASPARRRRRRARRHRAGRRAGDRSRPRPGRRPAPTSPRTSALPNYANNWRRLGFTDDDIADGGSDRLVDALVVWGDEATIAARVQEHRDAGASHVCVQVLDRRAARLPARAVARPRARAHR